MMMKMRKLMFSLVCHLHITTTCLLSHLVQLFYLIHLMQTCLNMLYSLNNILGHVYIMWDMIASCMYSVNVLLVTSCEVAKMHVFIHPCQAIVLTMIGNIPMTLTCDWHAVILCCMFSSELQPQWLLCHSSVWRLAARLRAGPAFSLGLVYILCFAVLDAVTSRFEAEDEESK